ncbi:hypothetical protein [Arthrobacter rhombi]|uniref:hypothetical protein n=1 Tax=Arthrobacter rhombi TaxID=71253 RepID=UPI003FD5A32C
MNSAGAANRPGLNPGQVYVTKGGKKYHAEWCTSINGTFNSTPHAVSVIDAKDAGRRTPCTNCKQPDTGPLPAPSWATATTPGDRGTTNHHATTKQAESFAVRLGRTDDAEGAGDPIVTVSADLLELTEAQELAEALLDAIATARAQ